jgi:F-type H+-transporting ATPase subunit a
MHIDIAAETVFKIGDWPITNSMLMSLVALVLTIAFMLFVARAVKKHTRDFDRQLKDPDYEPAKLGFFTRLAIWCYTGLENTVKQVVPNARIARAVAPFSISIFFFVILNYYMGVLPFVGPITENGTPLLRGGAADLNFTFMLAILTIIMVQVYAFRALGVRGNLHRYFVNPFKDPIGCFSGILELISEFSRMLALSMRLFGNCFAGEVLLIVVGYLTSFAATIALPMLYIFELFIGGIQAYIFFMLASVFSGIAVAHGDHMKTDQPVQQLASGDNPNHSISNHSDEAKRPSEAIS